MKKTLAFALALIMSVSLFSACGKDTGGQDKEMTAALTDFSDPKLFEQIEPVGTKVDLNDYYNELGVECDMGIRATGGSVKWLGGGNVPLPMPSKTYTIAFSDYYTVDEVGAMYMEGMKQAAEEIGVNLITQDADYDQNLQNQAIEQWILEGVDAVIMTPCDFYACKDGLEALHEAGIPVITLDAPPCAGEVDACVVYDAVEQGRQAGDALREYLLSNGSDMKGTIYYGTLQPSEDPQIQTAIKALK